MYFSDTKDFRIAVIPQYQEDISSRHNSNWNYSVYIENNSKFIAQLVSKYWRITYADGTTHEILNNVTSEERQIIEPGTVLELKNNANFKTNSAIIEGHYVISSKTGEFEIKIPTFSLDNPYHSISIN